LAGSAAEPKWIPIPAETRIANVILQMRLAMESSLSLMPESVTGFTVMPFYQEFDFTIIIAGLSIPILHFPDIFRI
ncbi:MAG: hypothetical protein KKE37_02105, partial [Verrucomicrobia bacterium]|nr:hypothetical protein [Verrucomicrobiota bacterium]MCG2681525.1 hypothetical protein [Kiritimatiellia bacterium]